MADNENMMNDAETADFLFESFLASFMENERAFSDFLAFDKEVQKLVDEGMSENEALNKVADNWDFSKARKLFGMESNNEN